ncbi:MAG: hypothetical protein IH604_02105 [Burkholderiales bacterium]|nr:hypothetical protein [Burkholderiales bacterium]
MNKYQIAALIVAAINVSLMLLFPPYDYLSYTRNNIPNFNGFQFVFGDHSNSTINSNLLSIEIVIVAINTAIVCLLQRDRARMRRRLDRQNLVLLGVALNLLLALLFPPFQDHYVVSTALVPSFDGFYFIFGDNSRRVIVAVMLWLELVFILVNGAMLWLLFQRPGPRELTAAERFAQPKELLAAGTRGDAQDAKTK